MTTLTVTAKGQVTLRKDVLRHLGVQPGDRITVEKLPDGRIEARAEEKTGRISDVFDMFKARNGISLTIEEMNELIEKGWAAEL